MDIVVCTEPLSYIEFRDFIMDSADWFVPSLHTMPDLNKWILKMFRQGFMYYSKSESNIIALMVIYHNVEKHFIYIPYICVHPDCWGCGISRQILSYLMFHLPAHINEVYLEVRKDNERGIHLYEKLGFYEFEDRGVKHLMKKEIYKINV